MCIESNKLLDLVTPLADLTLVAEHSVNRPRNSYFRFYQKEMTKLVDVILNRTENEGTRTVKGIMDLMK